MMRAFATIYNLIGGAGCVWLGNNVWASDMDLLNKIGVTGALVAAGCVFFTQMLGGEVKFISAKERT